MSLRIINRTSIPRAELERLSQPLAAVAPVSVVEQPMGPVAMWETILPTALALVIVAPVSGFLQKLGEDVATGLVASLHALFRRAGTEDLTMYRLDRQEPRLEAEPRLVPAAKAPPFSVEMEPHGYRVRFIFPHSLDEAAFSRATASMRERALWVEAAAAAFTLDQDLKRADPKRLLGDDNPQHVGSRLMHQEAAFRSVVPGAYVYVPERDWWVHVA